MDHTNAGLNKGALEAADTLFAQIAASLPTRDRGEAEADLTALLSKLTAKVLTQWGGKPTEIGHS